MNLNTIWALSYGDDGCVINEDDKIMITFITGEKLMGKYQYSDFNSLTLERNNVDIDIEFEEIENIEVLNN